LTYHYSEDGVEDISLKRKKKQIAQPGDNTRGYVEKEKGEIKGQKKKCTPRKWPEYVSQYKEVRSRWSQR
jgi:hypothetical protein